MCGSAPSAPQLPQYPGLTPAQQTNLGQQSGAASQMGGVVGSAGTMANNNSNIMQMLSGLFNSDGSINQTALTALGQQTKQSNQMAGQQGLSSLQGVGGTNQSLAQTNTAYQNALTGGAPANQQIAFQQNQNFQAMKEQAAQQGIQITGDNWANATSSSTAGLKLLQNAQQNNNMQNQNYNLGYLGQLTGNMGQLAGTANQQSQTGMGLSSYSQQNPLSMATGAFQQQSAMAPLLSSYQNQLSSAYQPLYQQQIGPYEQQMAQQQGNYQAGMNQYNAGQSQMMGWANLGATMLGQAKSSSGSGIGAIAGMF